MPEQRPFVEVRKILLERARQRRNPFFEADPAVVEQTLDELQSVDPQLWVETWSARAEPHQARAAAAERAEDGKTAMREYLSAYEFWRLARYPAPNCAPKREAYRASQQMYLKAAHWFDPPLQRVWMPFAARDAEEGQFVIGDLRLPTDKEPPYPVVVHWGGIDSFKEERRAEPYLGRGLASLAVDMPGVGDAPIDGSPDAERQWDAIFDWIAAQPELDPERVAIHGASTGGYWAAKLAHTHRDRIRAAVDHGGPAHHAFQRDWIEQAQTGEYPFELAETLAAAFGGNSYADWLKIAPSLSLLQQGVLDQPCAPLLLVNGVEDSVFPVQDMYLLLEHGSPKTARLFAHEGHMGGAQAVPTIISWLADKLSPGSGQRGSP
jgi:pimeloyl-ACP methyl ester carboxylesterase